MKTLMQIAPVQAALQSPANDPKPTKETSNQFTPHLEKAITAIPQVTTDSSSKTLPPSDTQLSIDTVTPEASEFLFEPVLLEDTDLGTAKELAEEFFLDPLELVSDEEGLPVATQDKNGTTFTSQDSNIQFPGVNLEIQAQGIDVAKEVTGQKFTIQPTDQNVNLQVPGKPVTINVTSINSPSLATGKESSLLSGLKNDSALFSPVTVSLLANQKTDFSDFSEPLTRSPDQLLKLDFQEVQSHNANTTLSRTNQNQTLLQHLHQIIESGNEIDTVAIEARAGSYSFQYKGVAGSQVVDIASSPILSQAQKSEGIIESPGAKTTALRQDMLGQYFDAKLSTKEQSDSAPNTQTSDQQNNTSGQQTTASQQPNSTTLPEQANSFLNISTLIQDIQNNQTQGTIKQVTLPSGTVVDEDNVIQQVAERFQINNRANDIKLNLKLHPEELGQLKIDLTLKEGSIKGNIVAQSQQIQEVIEKNMVKLRSILEDQGFTVEEIVVTSESDSVPDYDLFEQQLSQQNDFTTSYAEISQGNDFDVALEDAVVQSTGSGSSTGVNIKA